MDLFRNRDTSVATPDPNVIPVPGTPDDRPGWFVDCDLDDDLLGTPIGAYWLNMITAEIRNAILDGEVSPQYTDWNQLKLAIQNTARRIAISVFNDRFPKNPPPLIVRPNPTAGQYPDINAALATLAGKFTSKDFEQIIDIQGNFPDHPVVSLDLDGIKIIGTGPCTLNITEAPPYFHALSSRGKRNFIGGVTINYSGIYGIASAYDELVVQDCVLDGGAGCAFGLIAGSGGKAGIVNSTIRNANQCITALSGSNVTIHGGNPAVMNLHPLQYGLVAEGGGSIAPGYGPGAMLDIHIHGGDVGVAAQMLGYIDLNNEIVTNTADTGYQAKGNGVIYRKGGSPGSVVEVSGGRVLDPS